MSKLLIINKEEFILEGEFERIKTPYKIYVDEENVLTAIAYFKENYVDKGLAVGFLNDGFLTIPTEYGDQVEEEDRDPAFMILNIYWDRKSLAICGSLIILPSQDGDTIKDAILQGADCFISISETESYTVMDKDNGKMYCKISNIGGYKISLIQNEYND
jgi:hypothetical protein